MNPTAPGECLSGISDRSRTPGRLPLLPSNGRPSHDAFDPFLPFSPSDKVLACGALLLWDSSFAQAVGQVSSILRMLEWQEQPGGPFDGVRSASAASALALGNSPGIGRQFALST